MPTNCNRIYYALRIAVRRLPACDGPITAISPVPLYATGHFCVRNCPGRTRDAPSEGKIGLIQFRFPASSHVGWHRIPPLPAKLISGGGRLPLPAVPPNALDGSRAAIRSVGSVEHAAAEVERVHQPAIAGRFTAIPRIVTRVGRIYRGTARTCSINERSNGAHGPLDPYCNPACRSCNSPLHPAGGGRVLLLHGAPSASQDARSSECARLASS